MKKEQLKTGCLMLIGLFVVAGIISTIMGDDDVEPKEESRNNTSISNFNAEAFKDSINQLHHKKETEARSHVNEIHNKIKVLLTKFHKIESFEGDITYVHKRLWNWNNAGANFSICVTPSGYTYARSHFVGTKYIKHYKTRLKINGKIWETDPINTHDRNRAIYTFEQGKVNELIIYTDRESITAHNNLFPFRQAIRAYAENPSVLIQGQLKGQLSDFDFTLAKTQLEAINESLELSELYHQLQ